MADKYKDVDVLSRVESANPHQLIELLLQGARTNIASAIGFMQHNNIKKKGEHITQSIEIINGLINSLDHERGGKMADDLLRFYKNIQTLLLSANIKNDQALLEKANSLLGEVFDAWKAIKPEA
jgi:flagellar protein FliS